MKIKTVPKTASEIRAEFAAMPEASRSKERTGMRVTQHGSLTRLQEGMIIDHCGAEYRVDMVNECRARCVPVNKTRKTVAFTNKKGEACEFTPEFTGSAINISPNSECQILRRSSLQG